MVILSWIFFGAFIGWLAGLIMGRRGQGCMVNIALGLVGAVAGGFLFRALTPGFSYENHGFVISTLVAVVGAIIVIAAWNAISGQRRPVLKQSLWFAALVVCAGTAQAATPCDGIWQKSRADGARLLKKTAPQIIGLPARPRVYDVMQAAGWTIVWAEFPGAESAGYFIHDGRFLTNWAGVAAGDTASDLTAWAVKQDKTMPRPLAACFGWYVAEGREKSPPAWRNPFSN